MKHLIKKLMLKLFAKKFAVVWNEETIDSAYDVLSDRIINHIDYEW